MTKKQATRPTATRSFSECTWQNTNINQKVRLHHSWVSVSIKKYWYVFRCWKQVIQNTTQPFHLMSWSPPLVFLLKYYVQNWSLTSSLPVSKSHSSFTWPPNKCTGKHWRAALLNIAEWHQANFVQADGKVIVWKEQIKDEASPSPG